MTYIEFFDKTASENIAACLTHAPERVIFIGDSTKSMKRHMENYARVFKGRGLDVEILYRSVSKSNLENAVKLLQQIVDTYEDCVFDITGGEEILNVALCMVFAENPNKNIRITRYNLHNNTAYDCDSNGKTEYKDQPRLSVDEDVLIYGGEVAYGDVSDEKTYKWLITSELEADIARMWEICKHGAKAWNNQLTVFAAADEVGKISDDGLVTVASIDDINRQLGESGRGYMRDDYVVGKLRRYGLLMGFDDDDGVLSVAYKDPQVKRCLVKAGQALEMRVYLAAMKLRDEDGAPVYHDVVNGVFIDWDGKLLGEEGRIGVCDTENEVDVMMMHGMVPVFVSCKNGFVESDELYKLNIVAERFGGKYARKVLVASAISVENDHRESLKQRMADMNIRLIGKEDIMDDERLKNKLKTLWK